MKRINFLLFIFFGIILSCTKEDDQELITKDQKELQSESQSDIVTTGFEEQKQIVLGGKISNNPYSLESMKEAFEYYYNQKANVKTERRPDFKNLKPTHYYIKINPNNETHLRILDSLDNLEGEDALVIHDYPLDYKIEEEGDFYVNPKSETDLYYPAYVVIPVEYQMSNRLPFEKQTELYKPNEQEDDIESISIIFNSSKEEIIEEFGAYYTIDDLPMLLSLDENNPEHVQEHSGWFGRRYRPRGWVKVQNTDTNRYEPLRKAKISIGRGFWWRYTYTDNRGYFRAPKKYRGKVRIRAKWRGYTATIRKSWNELLGFWVSDHLMTIKRRTNGRTKHISTREKHLWYKGTVHNGLRKYNDYVAARGIYYPICYANVWVWENGKNAGSTPMLYRYPQMATFSQIAGIGEANLWEVLTSVIAGIGIKLLPPWLRPDQIYSGLKNQKVGHTANSARIEQLVWHESAHYSHARKTGAWFWAELFASELVNSIHHGNPYLDGSEPTYQAGKRIALAEGWATFLEFKAVEHHYGKAWTRNQWQNNPTDYMEDFDMYTVPMTVPRFDNRSWFLTGLIWDILDNKIDKTAERKNGRTGDEINPIRDNLYLGNNFSFSTIFNLLNGNVESLCALRSRLISSYPNDITQINQLFNSYGSCILPRD